MSNVIEIIVKLINYSEIIRIWTSTCIFVVLCFSMVRKFLKFKENTITRFNSMLIFLRVSSKLKVKQE